MTIFKPKPSTFRIFLGLLPKSLTHTGLICGKTWSRISHAQAPLINLTFQAVSLTIFFLAVSTVSTNIFAHFLEDILNGNDQSRFQTTFSTRELFCMHEIFFKFMQAKPTVSQPSNNDATKVMVDWSKILKNEE